MSKFARQVFVFPPIMVMSVYFTALGFMVPTIQEMFALSAAEVGILSTMQSIGTFAALVLCFCLFSAMNKSRIFLLTTTLFAVCLILLAYNNIITVMYILLILIGLLTGIGSTVSNSLMVDGTTKKTPSYYIGILHGVWAGMAAVGPFFVLLLDGDYTKTFLWLGILTLATLVIYAFGLRNNIKQPTWEDKSKVGTIGKLLRTFKYRGMKVILVIAFLTTIIRVGFTFFIRSYISFMGGETIVGAYVIGVMFIGMLIGRLTYGRVSHRVSANKVLLVSNVIAVIAFLAMLLTNNMALFIILMAVGAICISINVPIMIAKAYEIIPNDSTGATSFVFLSLVAGSFIGPPLIGLIGDYFDMRIALLVCVSVLIPVIILALRMLQREKLKRRLQGA